jgi:hypothetical protein
LGPVPDTLKRSIFNVEFIVFKTSLLKELGDRLGGKIVVDEREDLSSIQIDSNEDIMLCNCRMDILGNGEQGIWVNTIHV